jgi:hypothetical protein
LDPLRFLVGAQVRNMLDLTNGFLQRLVGGHFYIIILIASLSL